MKKLLANLIVPAVFASLGIAAVAATQSPVENCCEGDSPKVVLLSDGAATAPATSTAPAAVDLHNTKCIVSLEPASDSTTYTFEGKIYHFCCDDCIVDFKKDPTKFAKEVAADPAKFGIKK